MLVTDAIRPIIFARYPTPGQCKTRLIPALGADGAAALYRELLQRTVTRLAPLSPILCTTGAPPEAFHALFGATYDVRPQLDVPDLGERMLAALSEEAAPADTGVAARPALIVGSDAPDLDLHHVEAVITRLGDADLALGPAEDGGFWAIGMRIIDERLFAGVEWSTPGVMLAVANNAARLGLTLAYGPRLADLDMPQDLERWPDLAPQ